MSNFKFSLQKDSPYQERSAWIVVYSIWALVAIVLLVYKIFNGGVHFTEGLGFVIFLVSLLWMGGAAAKYYVVEGVGTFWNSLIAMGLALAGVALIFA